MEQYRGYRIKRIKDGLFGAPENMDCNKERWGCTPTFARRIELEVWIDNILDDNILDIKGDNDND